MTTASTRLAWLTDASCATRPDLPWTADAADVTADEASRMHAVCQACPVLQAVRGGGRRVAGDRRMVGRPQPGS